jgi:hypothetical protein
VYGLINTKTALFCADHKAAEHVNVKNKTCQHLNCKKRASYGKAGYSPEYCAEHKLTDMVYNPTQYQQDEVKLCEFCSCPVNYKDKYCKSCKTYITLGKTVKHHAKENTVKNLLQEHEIKYTHDLIVKDGCSRKRPDFIINPTWGTIILEVDEFQHNRKTYTCECEIQRMKMLYFDVGVENLLFIRYNPDEYTALDNVNLDDTKRKKYLLQYLRQTMSDTTHKGLGVVYLFYDGFIHTQQAEIEKIARLFEVSEYVRYIRAKSVENDIKFRRLYRIN